MRRLSMLLALVVALVVPAAPAQAAPALPTSIASTGDSITRAFDPTWSCFLIDCPRYSWSTGSSTSVPSHYRRIAAAQPGVPITAFNDAKSGARMIALRDQMLVAAGQGARYVTVLMGANDLCTSSKATMTPVDTFRSQFQAALTAFFEKSPDALVFVSSIPDIHRLWYLFRYNFAARSTWQSFGICQSMLSLSNTSADRQAVIDRELAFNAVLEQECELWVGRCRWDEGATYDFVFQASHVSTVDYFHPSVSGQAALAEVTWKASYWGS